MKAFIFMQDSFKVKTNMWIIYSWNEFIGVIHNIMRVNKI